MKRKSMSVTVKKQTFDYLNIPLSHHSVREVSLRDHAANAIEHYRFDVSVRGDVRMTKVSIITEHGAYTTCGASVEVNDCVDLTEHIADSKDFFVGVEASDLSNAQTFAEALRVAREFIASLLVKA